ncbi:hypothetical protein THOM_2372, partial [Trachipleistophora hominis]
VLMDKYCSDIFAVGTVNGLDIKILDVTTYSCCFYHHESQCHDIF